jgi:hypothetical protein
MKKFALVALFAVAVFGLAFAVTTQTGSVSISGSDPEVFTLTLPPNYSGTIANGSTTQTLFIGNVVVNSNVKDWFIKVMSAHSAYLVNSGDPNEMIKYGITLGSETFDPNDYDPVDGWGIGPQPRTPKAGLTLPFSLIINPSNNFYQAGNYSDTITFTIFGN